MFTHELKTNPNCCPYCGSHGISVDFDDMEDSYAFFTGECGDCGKTWREDYEVKYRVDRDDLDEVEL